MEPLSLAALGFSALSSIPQWITGYKQGKRANQLSKDLVRPEFEIPESQTRALGLAENLAEMDRLPGQSATEGRLDQTTASQIAMIERLGIGGPTSINAASTAYGNQQEQETALGVKAAEFKVKNQLNLQDELGDQANWEQEAWKWNKAQPYQNKANAIEALTEGSIRNKNAAWKNIFGIGAGFFGGMAGADGKEKEVDWLGGLFDGNKYSQQMQGNNTVSTAGQVLQPNSTEATITTAPEQKRIWDMNFGGF